MSEQFPTQPETLDPSEQVQESAPAADEAQPDVVVEAADLPDEAAADAVVAEAEAPVEPVAEAEIVGEVESPAEAEAATEVEVVVAETPEPSPAALPRPSAPRPAAPSPAALARLHPHPAAAAPPPHSDSARFGRVDEQGHVFVQDGDEEREVGSFPGGTPDEALQYFARKYDELASTADLLWARVSNPEVPAKELSDGLSTLRTAVADAHVVGDLPGLRAQLDALDTQITDKRERESAARAEAKAAAMAERENVVAQAEVIADQPPQSTQWKQSSEQMRALLDQWKAMQRSGPRLDKPQESELWQRFSKARNAFDKNRRAFFAELDETRSSAKSLKESLVAEAEELAASTDWNNTARSFKQLMDRWRTAGRASRTDDDRLWTRFKAAQDSFFAAKDEVSHAEDEALRGNLSVKEALLVEAEALLPVSNLEAAKASLRGIQDRWERAGKVPRADLERVEKALRRVEAAVRDADERKWRASDPEVSARASSLVSQLVASIASLTEDLEAAQAKGDARKVKDLTAKLAAQQAWLGQAQAVQGDA